MKKAAWVLFLMVCSAISFGSDHWQNLELFKPLSHNQVGLMPNGNLVVLDIAEHQFLVLKQGGEVKRFSRKGKGPGELFHPLYLQVVNTTFWVYCHNGFSQFDQDGHYLQTVKPKNQAGIPIPVSNGFLVLNPLQKSVSRASRNLELEDKVLGWQVSRLYPKQRERLTYYPAWETIKALLDHQEGMFFVVHTGRTLKITQLNLYDWAFRTFENTQIQALPMNKDWAQEQFKQRFRSKKVKLALLESFPLVKQAWLAPGKKIVLELWTRVPDKRQSFHVINYQGDAVTLGFDPKLMVRLLAFDKTQAFLAVFSEAEEASVVSCSLDAIEKTAQRFAWNLSGAKEDAWVRIQ